MRVHLHSHITTFRFSSFCEKTRSVIGPFTVKKIENARIKAENEAVLLKPCTENEAAIVKAPTDKDNQAVLIKVRQDADRKKRKADITAELNLKFVKRKRDLKKKVIELEVKQSIVEENRTLNDVEVERGLVVRAGLAPPPPCPNYLLNY